MGRASVRHKIRGLEPPPEVLSAFVLERLKQDAERRLGPIREVVITVPAFFDETRRKATQDAGRLAHLEVLDIINEPTAAALAFGYQQRTSRAEPGGHRRQADAGAGLRLGRRNLRRDHLGDRRLPVPHAGHRRRRVPGRQGFRRAAGELSGGAVHRGAGRRPRSDPQDAAQLWLDAQEAKHTLSERTKATVVCFHAGIRMRMEITRAQFEELTRDLLERTETTTSLVIKQAGLQLAQIDRVLLVGGSSRMPMVGQMLRKVTGKEPDCSQSPDEAVAHGAALYAGMLMRERTASGGAECALINVNSHSLGVVGIHAETRHKTNVVLIPKNTALPCRAVRTFKTARADQRSVRCGVVEGESDRPEACIALGRVHRARLAAGTAASIRRSKWNMPTTPTAASPCPPGPQRPLFATRGDQTRVRAEPG